MPLHDVFPWLDAIVSADQLHRLGWVIVHSLWQATAVAVALAVGLRLLPRHSVFALQARYALAILSLVALPIACAVTYALVEPPAAAYPTASPPTATPVASATRRMVVVPAAIAERRIDRAAALQQSTAQFPVDIRAAFVALAQQTATSISPWLPCCAALWLAGVTAAAGRLGVGWWLTRRLVAQAIAPADAHWQARLDRWKSVLGIAGPIRLLASARIDVPVVVGWLEPVVLWPLAALTGMPPDQIDAILAHELAHVRRHDVFVNLLQSCIETLFFHHPAAWWISAQVRAEREHCADDLAIRGLEHARAGSTHSYALALISLEERRRRTALAVAANGGSLVDRVGRLAGIEPAAGHPARLAAAALVVATVIASAATVATTPRPALAADATNLPDVIVSAIAVNGGNLVVEIQNQGPGAAQAGTKVEAVMSGWQTGDDAAKPKEITVSLPVPVKPMAVEHVTVPLDQLGLEGPVGGVDIRLDPKKKLAESRPDNNAFGGPLDQNNARGRAAYVDVGKLPDLVITDVVHDGPYLRVTCMNVGEGATGADFTIKWRSGEHSFPGNTNYRFKIPPPGQKVQTGGLTLGLIGLKHGMEADVEVIVDPEDRVRETKKSNNTFRKKVVIAPER